MLKQLQGSQAVAMSVGLARPDVICAYPISPQTHIVEHLGRLVRTGQIANAEYINVESEFAAMSVAIGASAAGGRSYTATASQGLLFMSEAIYNAAGLGLPIVMTVANRAIGAPINIWNDHSDSQSHRDSGWIQLFCENNQDAVDLHIQAFKIAEELSIPVMVCMDGFVLTHAYDRVDIPDQAQIDAFLPPFVPRQVLDPKNPYSIGAMVGPEAFTEVRYLQHHKMLEALPVIERVSQEYEAAVGRKAGGLVDPYRTDDAEVIVLALGSNLGTIKDTVDEMREDGFKIGVLGLTCFRPFPYQEIKRQLQHAKTVIVIDRMLSPSMGGVVFMDVMFALKGTAIEQKSVIAGLGGRQVTRKDFRETFTKAFEGTLPDETVFMKLDRELVDAQLARKAAAKHTGPMAEAMNRHVAMRKLAAGEEI